MSLLRQRPALGRFVFFGMLLGALGVMPTLADVEIPLLKTRVTDLTQTLNAQQTQSLEAELAALETRKGAQIAVLIVPSTAPETIEQYARRVLDEWKLGRKGIDDGALLLVAKDDRKLRIETQYGLEGVIPDAIAKRIVVEDITPAFKRGDYYGGIQSGINRMSRLVEGEPLPPPQEQEPGWTSFGEFLPFLIFAIVVLGGFLRSAFGQFFGATIVGGVVGVFLWVLLGSIVVGVVAGLIAFLVVLFGGGGGGRGGWSSGGGGSSWSGGSSWGGGGGGFSGGGGSGGGGGASGSW